MFCYVAPPTHVREFPQADQEGIHSMLHFRCLFGATPLPQTPSNSHSVRRVELRLAYRLAFVMHKRYAFYHCSNDLLWGFYNDHQENILTCHGWEKSTSTIPPIIISPARILFSRSCLWEEGLMSGGTTSKVSSVKILKIILYILYIAFFLNIIHPNSCYIFCSIITSLLTSWHGSIPATQHHLVEELRCTWPRQLNPCLWQRFATNEGLQAICFPSSEQNSSR